MPAYFQRKPGESIRSWDADVGGGWSMDGQSAGTDGDLPRTPAVTDNAPATLIRR